MIKPLYNNVLLKKVEASNTTASGIIISQKEETEEYAIVEATSDEKEVIKTFTAYNSDRKDIKDIPIHLPVLSDSSKNCFFNTYISFFMSNLHTFDSYDNYYNQNIIT